MGAGGDGKPATVPVPPLTVTFDGKDGHAATGTDVVAAKAKHMNQLMDPLADEKKLLIDFKSLLAQAPMSSFGASGGIVPAWMKGKKPAAEAPAAKPSMKTVRPPLAETSPHGDQYHLLPLLAKLWSGTLGTLSTGWSHEHRRAACCPS